MKKIIYLLFLSVVVASCRQDDDYIPNPNDPVQAKYSTYTGQFEAVWNAINTGYSFWDVTDVDWDQRYREFKPRFEELDRKYKNDSVAIDSAAYSNIYYDLTEGLIDHHMYLDLRDPVKNGKSIISVSPSDGELMSRSYFHISVIGFFQEFFPSMCQSEQFEPYMVSSMGEYSIVTGHYTLSDGRIIPYLWTKNFKSIDNIREGLEVITDTNQIKVLGGYVDAMDKFHEAVVKTPREKLAGVIIDVRGNGGGEMDALKEYGGIFICQPLQIGATRYKEGMGRYDMSAWAPFTYPCNTKVYRDVAAENIPVVLLCDVSSASCSESTTYMVKSMPTGHVIGERTMGAQGPLFPSTSHSVTYSGVVGDGRLAKTNHYIYTSNFQIKYGDTCLEGIGVTPDEEVLYNKVGYLGQFDAAIKYIENYK